MRGLILSAALGAAALTGCYATGDVGYSASATYSSAPGAADDGYAATPDLVTVQPGVQVVADYDEPVFFTDGFYWRFYDGYWYRSNNYAYGWYYWSAPPIAVVSINNPYRYVHYRPTGYVARRNVRYRPPAAIVTDHRRGPAYVAPAGRGPAYAPPAGRPPAYAPPAAVRDHRAPPPAAAPGGPAARAPAAPAPAPAPPAAAPVRDHRAPAKDKDTRDHRH